MAFEISRPIHRRGALLSGLAVAGTTLLPRAVAEPEPLNGRLSGNISPVHDPCMIRAGDTYYVFSTNQPGAGGGQIPWRYSKDLVSWDKGGTVLAELPQWAKQAVDGTEGIWAPDISFAGGRYLLYYACSTFGKNRSVIGLLTNATLDPSSANFKWVDQGLVIESKPNDNFNAIDPNHVVDRSGRHWLTFGSFWGGIKLVELDPASGKPLPGRPMYALAKRPTDEPGLDAIEAPFIIERGGYYYLFCAFDFCCRGADSNYYTVVGRATEITGPYSDASHNAMMYGNAAMVMKNDSATRWRGPGGASILRDGSQDYIVYHAYDARRQGVPTLRIAPLVWSADGWPSAMI
jgi:arabinan endo-1,5-alpha-L-arabinosidase